MRLKREIKRDPFLPILNFFRNVNCTDSKRKKTWKAGRGEKEGRKGRSEGGESQDKSIRIWTGNISEYFI